MDQRAETLSVAALIVQLWGELSVSDLCGRLWAICDSCRDGLRALAATVLHPWSFSSGALWGGGGGGLVIRGRRIRAIRCTIEAGKESDEFMKSSLTTMTTVLLRVQKITLMQTTGCSKQMRILVCILILMHTPASCLCYLLEMYINHWRQGDIWWCFLHYHLLVSWHVHLF